MIFFQNENTYLIRRKKPIIGFAVLNSIILFYSSLAIASTANLVENDSSKRTLLYTNESGTQSFSLDDRSHYKSSTSSNDNSDRPTGRRSGADAGKPPSSVSGGDKFYDEPPLPITVDARSKTHETDYRPPGRVSGGDRGNQCLELLVALVPGSDNVSLDDSCNSDSISELALTSLEQPILWFYIPEAYASTARGTLYVMDHDGQTEFEQIVQLSGQSGIVGIQLGRPLEVGQTYRWLFEIRASARRSENPFVEGLIQQELPSNELASQLDTASELEQAQLYLNAGLWHDALTQLLQIQQTGINTPEWQSIWMSTLESEGLGALSEMPITDCCILEQLPAAPEL